MTIYTVHLYREMRLVYRTIEAASPDEAARIASAKATDHAHQIEDCEGLSYSALVESDNDGQHVALRADGGEIEPRAAYVTNRTRALHADAAVSVFIQHTGTERTDALGDLLCDLMHWSKQNDFDFALALNRAKDQFEDECTEEEVMALTACAPDLADALLEIKLLAQKHDDSGCEPYTLLELIEQKALAALAQAKGAAQ